ncbi:hypothetical protein GCM10008018_21250 [Paenibacillus marchantiophytorum]|uniref:Big-1 domain-containing protein n=1 Tax=Paenibacillus marchantiophytorum TaxID=1619310 RepID=A0ABQ1EKI5_9BACL|nr:Ig-like domain-containing protein [Paenibacillus marchantiophytorum]GFZ75783.1 hypothetical protein GCM10008018_21250 [Paenibacillus marchantiophytorum]
MKLLMKQIISLILVAVLFLSGIFPAGTGVGTAAQQADWEEVGARTPSPFYGSEDLLNLQVDQGIPYMAFIDQRFVGGKITYKVVVMKYENNDWVGIGNTDALKVDNQSRIALFVDNGVSYLLFLDAEKNKKMSLAKFNETSDKWEFVGDRGFGENVDMNPHGTLVVKNGVPYVTYLYQYQDASHRTIFKAVVQNYTEATGKWQEVFTDVNASSGHSTLFLDEQGTMYMGYNEYQGFVVKKYSGNEWQLVGVKDTSVAANAHVVYVENGNVYYSSSATVKKLSKSGMNTDYWATLGGSFFNSIVLDTDMKVINGTPFVSYIDRYGGKITVKRFNGESWSVVGTPNFSQGDGSGSLAKVTSRTSLAVSNGYLYAAYTDGLTRNAMVKRIPVPDMTPPKVTALTPENGAKQVAVDTDLTMTFDKDVVAGTSKYIKVSDNSTAMYFQVNDTTQVTVSGNKVTIKPRNPLASGTAYYVNVDAGAFRDLSDNPYAGINNNSTWTFTTETIADAAKSTIAASPQMTVADGTTFSTITVTVKDSQNRPIEGKTVELTANRGSSVITPIQPATDASGRATFKVTDRVIEQVDYTAKIGKTAINGKATVSFTAGEPDSGKSTVTAVPTSVPADGKTAAMVIVKLQDASGHPVSWRSVNLKADGGNSKISPVKNVSDENGQAVFAVTNTAAEQVAYTASTGIVTMTQRATVSFEAVPDGGGPGGPASKSSVINSTVSAIPETVQADGTQESTITVSLKDASGKPVVGKTVKLSADGGSSEIAPAQVVSDAAGQAVFKVKNAVAEQVTYTAKDVTDGVTIAKQAKVTFEASYLIPNAVSVLQSTVTASPLKVEADGSAVSTITVKLKTYTGQPVAGKTVNLSAGGGSSAIAPAQVVSGADGSAVFTVTNTVAEQVTYTAKEDTGGVTLAQRPTVTFESPAAGPGGPKSSVLASTVTASPEAVEANGTQPSTITVTLKDGSGQALSGKTVSLAASGGSSVITTVRGISDAKGQAVFTVTNTAAEPVTYTAKDETGHVTLAQQATVIFESSPVVAVTGKPSVTESTVLASPTQVEANGTNSSAITVTLKTVGGEPVSGKKVSLKAAGGSSVIAPAEAVSGSDGTAVFTVTNTAAEQVTYTAKDETDGITLAQRETVTFENSAAGPGSTKSSVVESTVFASPSTVDANGSAASTITVTLKTAGGQPVSGNKVRLTADGGSSVITPGEPVSSGPDGTAVFTVTNTVAEQVTYAAKDETDGVTVAQRAVVTFEAPAVSSGGPATSDGKSTVVASPEKVEANGSTASKITVTLKTAGGQAISGKPVSLTADGGSSKILPSQQVVSGADGTAVFTVTDTAAEQVTYTAKDAADGVILSQRATITFEAPAGGAGEPKSSVTESTVNASPEKVEANGSAASTITVTLKTAGGQAVSDKMVSLTALGGSSVISPAQQVKSGPEGTAVFTVTNLKAEQVTYTAKDETDGVTLAQRTKVTFEAPAVGTAGPVTSVIDSTVVASPEKVDANGIAASTITVTLKATGGQPVSGKMVRLTADGGSSQMAPSYVFSGADGTAVFTVTNRTAEQVTYTAKDETDGVSVAERATVTFEKTAGGAGAPKSSVAESKVVASPAKVEANGVAASTITVTLNDVNKQPIAGKTVRLTAAGGSSVITPAQVDSGPDGTAVFTVTNTVAEQVTYTAKDESDNVTIAQRAKVTFEAPAGGSGGPATSMTVSTVTASPLQVEADGITPSTITVTLKAADGQPVSGKTVRLTVNSGSSVIKSLYGASDTQAVGTDGTAVFKVTNASAEKVTYTAKDETSGIILAQRPTVIFEKTAGGGSKSSVTQSTVVASPVKVQANGGVSTITVTLKTAGGQPVSGKQVHLTPNSGTTVIDLVYGTSDAQGQATFNVTNSKEEQVTYTAKDLTDGVTLAQQAVVTFETLSAGGPGSKSSVSASIVTATPVIVEANGTDKSTIIVTLRDANNQPVSNKLVSLSASGGSSVINSVYGTSNPQGEVTFTVTNTVAEEITYSAKDETDHVSIAELAVVTFFKASGPGTPKSSVELSTVKATPAQVAANGIDTSMVTVTLKDANNQPVSGKKVSLKATGGSSVITAVDGTGTSNAQGEAIFTVTDIAAEQVTYTAKDETSQVSIAEQATVTFQSAPGMGTKKSSVVNSTVKATPSTVAADGTDKSTITVTLKDANNDPVSGKTVILTAGGSSSAITAVHGTSNGQGQAIFTVTNSVAEQVIYRATDLTSGVTIAEQATVTFQVPRGTGALPASVARSTITAAPVAVAANGKTMSTITVTLLDKNGQAVSGKTVSLKADSGQSVITTVQGVSDMQGQAVFTVTNSYAEKIFYSAKDETDQVNIAAKADVTFQTTPGTGDQTTSVARSTVIASPTTVDADGTAFSTITVTLKNVSGQPLSGKTVNLTALGGSSVIKPVQKISDTDGNAIFTVTDKIVEKVSYEAKEVTGNVKIGQRAEVTFQSPGEISKPIDPNNVTTDPDTGKVTVKDVEPGATVKIYDKDGNVIGTGTNPGPGKGPVIITIPGLKEGDVIKLTNSEPGKKESTKTDKTVTKEPSKPINPSNVAADPDTGKVTVKDVEPGATVNVYDKEGNVIGTGTNPGPGKGPVVITIPGLKEGDVIKLTNTDPGKKESTKTDKTVTKEPSKPIDPSNVAADPDTGKVTVKDVEPGATVNVYDKDGKVIGTGTNPGPGKGPVVITIPGLKEGDVIKLTNTEPGKKESTKTDNTVTKEPSKPIDPRNVTVDPDRNKVKVDKVPPGTKITIYDEDGNKLGEGENPGPGEGPVEIDIPGLDNGDIIRVTAKEPGHKESNPTNVIIPNKPKYDVITAWKDKDVTVTVTLKPGAEPYAGKAYVVLQGMRNDTPVFVVGQSIDGRAPQPFTLHIDRAEIGDLVYAVVVTRPEYNRSDVGHSLSEERTDVVTARGE